ncbi:hypothetical protein RRG08_064715 [Elysia crispata]|uniref:Uncharacterized protein n=1 Tax=Elysia crispata TaxID=231223 RepID=A0AAE0YZH1_9GAST|nr:hypothetical protein RRG08_064715 [Elysia crispata]
MGKSHAALRFGGVHSLELLTTFINERTGLNRNIDGALQRQAGLIPKAESILEDHMEEILRADPTALKQVKGTLLELKETEGEHHQEMLKYYMYIVDKIAATGGTHVLDEMVSALDRTLFGREEKSTRTEETLKRRRNVLQSFRQNQRNFLEAKRIQSPANNDQQNREKPQSLPESKVTFHHQARRMHIHTELLRDVRLDTRSSLKQSLKLLAGLGASRPLHIPSHPSRREIWIEMVSNPHLDLMVSRTHEKRTYPRIAWAVPLLCHQHRSLGLALPCSQPVIRQQRLNTHRYTLLPSRVQDRTMA